MGEIVKQYQLISAIVLALLLWLAYTLRFVIAVVFLAYIIAVGFLPVTKYLVHKGLPRILAVLLPYFAATSLFLVLILPIIPLVADQVRALAENLPVYLEQLRVAEDFLAELNIDLRRLIEGLAETVRTEVVGIAGDAIVTISGLVISAVISIYLLYDWENTRDYVKNVFGPRYAVRVERFLDESENKIGAWIRGQLLLSLAVGFSIFILLFAAGIDFALALGIIAAVLEFIPYLGPIAASIPAILIGLNTSVANALLAAGIYILVNQLESHILVPKIMQNAVEIHPIAVILLLIIGYQLMGIFGAFIAIPAASVILVALRVFIFSARTPRG